ncbi:MAG: 50S ribosomal protein L4 [Bacilli bacterium]|nr:50S ribosomal protein L4 [Bacilli bacterium]MBN2697046.1 50S ribosomal protein L4 [Bacilli bacterium]
MPKLPLLNLTGETVGNIDLADSVFGVEPNQQVIYDVVRSQRASMRQGTSMTKNRSAVAGGGRKPYRQKGTGHARQGTIRAPQFVGGGVVFGPNPRSYEFKLNRKVRRLALQVAYSDKVREESLLVVKDFALESHKTKGVVEVLNNLKLDGKIMLVLESVNESLDIASRNLPNVTTVTFDHVSVYDLLNATKVVATEAAVKKIEEALS